MTSPPYDKIKAQHIYYRSELKIAQKTNNESYATWLKGLVSGLDLAKFYLEEHEKELKHAL